MSAAAHLARAATGKRVRVTQQPTRDFPPGHFMSVTLPSAESPQGWPPRFESQLQIDPRTRRFATEFQILHRPRVGFDSVALGLPGATAYEHSPPVLNRPL